MAGRAATGKKRKKKAEAPLYRYLIRPVTFALFTLLRGACWILPPAVIYLAARTVVWIGWQCSASRRRIVNRNLEIAFGDRYTTDERKGIARRSAQHFILSLLDLLILPRFYTGERWRDIVEMTPEQESFLAKLPAREVPLAFHTAHFGSWEFGPAILGLLGVKVSMVYRPLDFPRVDAEIGRLRCSAGNEVCPKEGALRGYVRTLRKNGCLGVIADQNAGRDGAFLSFFGVPVSTEVRHFALYRRFNARACAAFIERVGFQFKFRLRGVFEIALDPTADEATEAMRVGQWYNDCLQQVIEDAPDQYAWLHRRFRSRPAGAPSLYDNLDQPLDRTLLKKQPSEPILPPHWQQDTEQK